MGRWRTGLAHRTENPRTSVQLGPDPPAGMHDAFLANPRFPHQQSDRRLYNKNPILPLSLIGKTLDSDSSFLGSSPGGAAKQYHFLGTAVLILIYGRLVRRPSVLVQYHTRDRSSMCWKKKDAKGEITKTFRSSILV